jgi:hypothetical protein
MTDTTEDGRRVVRAELTGSGHIRLDGLELTVRIIEVLVGKPRPPGYTARECYEQSEETEVCKIAAAAAEIAVGYFLEACEISADQLTRPLQ